MKCKLFKLVLSSALFLALFWPVDIYATYIEGIDTTDVNGYGLDSAFRVSNGFISGQNLASYWFWKGDASGYFNYSFEDIKTAPDSSRRGLYGTMRGMVYYCFVIKKNKDSTYSKVQLLSQISGNRFTYKYGTNTNPNDRLLEKSDYDITVRYKPNNLFNNSSYCCPIAYDSLYWDPPIPNNNHLLGYIFYRSKSNVVIDTAAPINPAQWDSIAFFTSTKAYFLQILTPGYVNFVALYAEGKSDFLSGWTRSQYSADGIKQEPQINGKATSSIQVQKVSNGLAITYQPRSAHAVPCVIAIYNINGRELAQFTDVTGNSVLWNPSSKGWSQGMYILRAELPDHTVLTQPFLFTK
jgi:hypothetical protein